MLPDNKEFNVTFVQTVEEYPIVYDTTRMDYINRDSKDDAWNNIAERFESTEAECKRRWKNLRGGLTRYMKKCTEQKAKDQFYLWEDMQFVIPFLKLKPGYLPPVKQPDDSNDDDDDISSNISKDYDEICDTTETRSDFGQPAASASERPPKRSFTCKTTTSPEDYGIAVTNYISSKKEDQSNPDLDFFKSILPDIAGFSAAKKRKFKSKVLELINEFDEEETTSSPEYKKPLVIRVERVEQN
ncbi:hypothetical protein M8J76_008576 [Diaphorina citri]|nr:hypothetical protein M8J75_004521 [Diaphorina citri]KAI5722455.1 hypothetical protein M8J76_008576 [Diaphorina citri]KAI5726160.1 hypothetical protein M8J77_024672 [Diaphorina citri]